MISGQAVYDQYYWRDTLTMDQMWEMKALLVIDLRAGCHPRQLQD
jgi:hypothetical protein